MKRLQLIAIENIGRIAPGDDLGESIVRALLAMSITLRNGDVLAIAQKIVSKAEDRYVVLEEVLPSERAIDLARRCRKDPRDVELVLRESRAVLRAAPDVLVVEDSRGLVLANAGIDHSNVEPDATGRQRVLLLPRDPDASAVGIRQRVAQLCEADVGVLVVDSVGRAWRLGTIGTAIGVSGLPALRDLRGTPDLYARKLEVTMVGAADELACAASAVMGQAAEGTPAVLMRGVPWPRPDGSAADLQRPPRQDLFR